MRARIASLFATATLALVLPAAAQTSSPKAVLPDLPLPILQDLSYVDVVAGRALPLQDGVYVDAMRRVTLEPSLQAHGDLDGDGTRDAAVLLRERRAPDGTETLHVAAVVQRAARVRNMASLRLGESVQLRSLAIGDRQIHLQLLVLGEGDAPGRPTLQMALALKLAGSELQLMRQAPGGRFTAAALSGTSWTLAGDDAVTARIEAEADGTLRLAGRLHCGRYGATMDSGGAIADISSAPAGSLKTPCSAEAHAADRAFLAQLADTRRIAFSFGRLALVGGQGGAVEFAAP